MVNKHIITHINIELGCNYHVVSSMGCLIHDHPSASGLHSTYCSAWSLPESGCSNEDNSTSMLVCQYTADSVS